MSKIEKLKEKRDKLLANANLLSNEERAELKRLDAAIKFEVANSSITKPD